MINYRNYLLFIVLASVLVSLSGCLDSQSPPPQKLTPSEQNELKTLTMQLTDSDRLQKTHVDAAGMLLQKPYPQATQTLLRWLEDSSNPAVQNAIAAAIVQENAPRKEFKAPLLKMLTGKEPSVRGAAALALVTYKNGGVIDELIKIAANTKLDRDVRLTTIDAMQWSGSRRCVKSLIELLSDDDRGIRDAAGESLGGITNIRTLGTNRGAWDTWWKNNRNKTRVQWLSELTDSLTRSVMVLKNDNAALRKRLVRSITELYNASGKPQQVPMILEFLSDPIDDVRVLGLTLTGNMHADNEKIPVVLRDKIATMFNDPSPSIRQSTAVLEAKLGGPKIVETLLMRLQNEPVSEVRVGILNAMGQLKSPVALDAVLSNVESKDATEAAAAAEAFSKIVTAQPLTDDSQTSAADILKSRYTIAITGKNHSALREALLTAMATLGDASCTETLFAALKDPSGVIRLAAVNGLAQMNGETKNNPVKAEKIAPLCNDGDRGVRQGAIAALGKLNAARYAAVILKRTDPQIEPNTTVRKEAMQTVYSLLEQADSDTLKDTLANLDNSDATETLRIKIMQLYVSALKKEKAPTTVLVDGLMKLATQLRKTGRTDEAITIMAETYKLVQNNGENFPAQQISNVWFAYLETMLLGNDPGAIELMEKQTDKIAFANSLKMLKSRLLNLTSGKQFLPIISIATKAQQDLEKRLDDSYKTFLTVTLKNAQSQQELIDSDTVAKLTPLLIAPSETESAAAQTQLKGMAVRAIKPLAMQLESVVSSQDENPKLEKAIYDLLRQLAPNFGPYDLDADKAKRSEQIREILKKL